MSPPRARDGAPTGAVLTAAAATDPTVHGVDGELAAVLLEEVADHFAAQDSIRELLPQVRLIGERLCTLFGSGGRLYTFGNGGSAADAQHLVAEFVGRFRRERRALPAVALTTDPSVTTCIANDYSFQDLFARQVQALAGPGDMVVAFTTSGHSPNVVRGLAAARAVGATTVLFASGTGAEAAAHADHLLLVPALGTARTQEMHLLLLHLLSEIVDCWAAATPPDPPAAPVRTAPLRTVPVRAVTL